MSAGWRPRLLVLAARSRYIVPTEEELLAELSARCDVVFHGPGFLPLHEIEPDARRIWDRQGPFDAALIQQFLFFGSLPQMRGSQWMPFDPVAFAERFPDFARGFEALPCPRVLMLSKMDYYVVDAAMVERLQRFDGALWTWPAEFVPRIGSLPDLATEPFAALASDRYHDFAEANRHRIIPLAHCVAPQRFVPPAASRRRPQVAVPGRRYAARRDAVEALDKAGLLAPDLSQPLWLAGRIPGLLGGRSLHATWSGIGLLQQEFRRAIVRSRAAWADGSRLRYPLRKLFEIPAFGAVLLADRFAGADALGFRDGQTCLYAPAARAVQVARDLLADASAASRLAEAGQALVRQHHTPMARIAQLLCALQAIRRGRYHGARFIDGALHPLAPAAT
jgi:hypothetical protein